MQVSRLLWQQIQTLLAADTAYLASATAMKLHLAAAAFTPALDLDITTLVEATFTGSAAILCGTGTQDNYRDTADGLWTIEIKPPVGGFLFQCTVTPASPETIYGYWISDNGGTHLIASARVNPALTIQAAGDAVLIDALTMKFPTTSPV